MNRNGINIEYCYDVPLFCLKWIDNKNQVNNGRLIINTFNDDLHGNITIVTHNKNYGNNVQINSNINGNNSDNISVGSSVTSNNKQTRSLFIQGLSVNITEDTIKSKFETYGVVKECRLLRDPRTKKSKGNAIITFNKTKIAKIAKDQLHNREFMGKRLKISLISNSSNNNNNNSNNNSHNNSNISNPSNLKPKSPNIYNNSSIISNENSNDTEQMPPLIEPNDTVFDADYDSNIYNNITTPITSHNFTRNNNISSTSSIPGLNPLHIQHILNALSYPRPVIKQDSDISSNIGNTLSMTSINSSKYINTFSNKFDLADIIWDNTLILKCLNIESKCLYKLLSNKLFRFQFKGIIMSITTSEPFNNIYFLDPLIKSDNGDIFGIILFDNINALNKSKNSIINNKQVFLKQYNTLIKYQSILGTLILPNLVDYVDGNISRILTNNNIIPNIVNNNHTLIPPPPPPKPTIKTENNTSIHINKVISNVDDKINVTIKRNDIKTNTTPVDIKNIFEHKRDISYKNPNDLDVRTNVTIPDPNIKLIGRKWGSRTTVVNEPPNNTTNNTTTNSTPKPNGNATTNGDSSGMIMHDERRKRLEKERDRDRDRDRQHRSRNDRRLRTRSRSYETRHRRYVTIYI